MNHHVYFLIRSRNAMRWFDRCIDSIFSQTYVNYTILYIDDQSNLTHRERTYIRKKLRRHVVVFNNKRQYAVRNAYETIHTYCSDDDGIVISLDGDDWLARDDVIDIVVSTYNRTGCHMTYGNSLWYEPGTHFHGKPVTTIHPYANTRYPSDVEKEKRYRLVPFRAFHLRTWSVSAFKNLHISNFKFPDGMWLRFCEDQVITYALLESKNIVYTVINTPLSIYNASHENLDEIVNRKDKLIDEVALRKMHTISRYNVVKNSERFNRKHTVTIIKTKIYEDTINKKIRYIKDILKIFFKNTKEIVLLNEDRKMERLLAWAINYHYAACRCITTSAGYSLSYIRLPIYLSIRSNKRLWIRTVTEYENLMWSLTFSTTIDESTYNLLIKNGILLNHLGVIS